MAALPPLPSSISFWDNFPSNDSFSVGEFARAHANELVGERTDRGKRRRNRSDQSVGRRRLRLRLLLILCARKANGCRVGELRRRNQFFLRGFGRLLRGLEDRGNERVIREKIGGRLVSLLCRR